MRVILIQHIRDADNQNIVKDFKDVHSIDARILNSIKSQSYFYDEFDGIYIDIDSFEIIDGSDVAKIVKNHLLTEFIKKLK